MNKKLLANKLKEFVKSQRFSRYSTVFSLLLFSRPITFRPNKLEKLLIEGRSINKNSIKDEELDFLKKIKFVKEKGGKIIPEKSIIPIKNIFIVTDPVTKLKDDDQNFVFLGESSLITTFFLLKELNRLSNKNKIKILELGTGTGINLILIENRKSVTYGIELNKRAVGYSIVNKHLNNKRFHLAISNTTSIFKENTFSIVFSNIPFSPAPRSIKIPLSIHGGVSGFDLLKKEISNILKILRLNGKFIIYTSSIRSNSKKYNAIRFMKDLYENCGISIKIIRIGTMKLSWYYKLLINDKNKIDKIMSFYDKKQLKTIDFLIIIGTKNNKNKSFILKNSLIFMIFNFIRSFMFMCIKFLKRL